MIRRGGASAVTPRSHPCAGGAAADPCVISSKQDFTNGALATFDLGGRALVIANYGRIKVTPGGMRIVARSVEVQVDPQVVRDLEQHLGPALLAPLCSLVGDPGAPERLEMELG